MANSIKEDKEKLIAELTTNLESMRTAWKVSTEKVVKSILWERIQITDNLLNEIALNKE